MKTLKKALSIILGLAMVLSCVAGMQVSAAAEGNITLSVGEATVADGVVTVPVVVDENTGFQALAVTVDYDKDVLTLTKAVKNTEFAAVAAPGNDVPAEVGEIAPDYAKIMWAYVTATDVTATGTIATLTFNVVEGADVDTTAIDLEVTEAWDAADNAVTATANDGTVTFGPKRDTVNILQGKSYAAVSDVISVAFLLQKKPLVAAGYDDYKVEFSRQTFDNKYMYNKELDVQEIASSTATSTTAYYLYSGIGMYELNVPITVTVKCYKDSKYVAYNEFTLNVKDMILAVYNASNTADSMKSVIVDLLYLGKEAQEFFGKEGTDLATVALPTAGFDVEQTTEFNPDALATTKSCVIADEYKSVSGLEAGLNLNIAKNPGLYYIIGKMPTSTFPKADVAIETTYTNGLNGNVVTDRVTGDKATYAGSRYYYIFNKVAFYDLSQIVTTTVTCKDATVLTIQYTVESYIKDNYTNADQGELLVALAKFSKSARYHFIEK